MKVQAEVSLYPLGTHSVGAAIKRFVGDLEYAGLEPCIGNMSTLLSGDVKDVFKGLGEAFEAVIGHSQAVLIVKVSNACPSSRGAPERNTDGG